MTDKKNLYTARQTLRKGAEIRRRLWLPTLLFGDGLVMSVLAITMIMLRRFGLDTAETTLIIALFCLPLLLRPLFEMIVAHFWGTTKVWILSAQFISAMVLSAIAFMLSTASWLQTTLCFMPFFTCAAVFYDIALHRFYVNEKPNAWSATSTVATLTRFIKHCGYATMFVAIGIFAMIGGNMEVVTRNIRYSWSLVFYILAAIELVLWLWHSIFLPGGPHGYALPKTTAGLHRGEFKLALHRMLHRKSDIMALVFFVFFLLPETLLVIIVALFVIDKPHYGGLGLAPQEFALTQGTVAVIAIMVGYKVGKQAMCCGGLRRWLIPAALVLPLHGAALLYLSLHTTATLSVICAALAVGNAAFGFALSAVKAIAQDFVGGAYDTTLRHAIAQTLVAAPFIITNLFAGRLLLSIGYRQLFVVAMYLYAVTLLVATIAFFFNKYLDRKQ